MISLVYVSAASMPLSDADLLAILEESRRRNGTAGVTGVLAHRGSNCLGIIEGDEDVVNDRFAEIRRDPRHTDVREIAQDSIVERSFTDWTMAFVTDDARVRRTPGFLDLFDCERGPDQLRGTSRARALLEWFRRRPEAPLPPGSVPAAEARGRIIDAAIAVLHDVGLERFHSDAVAVAAGFTTE
jgi:hypothetical protein